MECLTDEQLNLLSTAVDAPPEFIAHLDKCNSCRERLASRKQDELLIKELREIVARDAAGIPAIEEVHTSELISRNAPDSEILGSSDSIPGYKLLREIHRGGQGV